MFVITIKNNTLKFVGVICLAVILAASLLFLVPRNGAEATAVSKTQSEINYSKIRTNDDRVKFLSQFGWEVEETPTKEVTVRVPKNFDDIMNSYNGIQTHQGLDLTKYSGKEVTRYTYKVTNYPDYKGDVSANVIVYKNKVIGGDICSADIDGFIHDFTYPGKDDTAPAETEAAPETEAPADTSSSAESESASESTTAETNE